MLEVRIHSLNVDALTNSPVVLLKELDGDDRRLLPIWIGHGEAMAILLRLQDVDPPRPLTHDLLRGTIDALGYAVERVEITRLEEGTFFADVLLSRGEEQVVVDARPSDSMALAVRTGAPIFVADEVWESASLIPEETTEEEQEDELRRFREFLEHVDPADFHS